MVLLQHYSNPGTYLAHIEPAVKLTQRILKNQTPRSKSGETPPQRFRQLRPEEIDEIVQAYLAGATARELGGQWGVHPKTIGKHLRTRGIDTTPPGLAPELVPEAVWLYEKQGWSTERIAVKFATSARTIRSRLLEAGVKMRDTHGRDR